jgi:two-component system, OmpR family, response regulator
MNKRSGDGEPAPANIQCLLVDDDTSIRLELQSYLQGFGITAQAAANAAEMRQLMAVAAFDVVILDIMLPDESGLSLCKWVTETFSAAVIMLTAHGDPASRVLGLEMGADDYLAKPFEPRELVARIHAVLRRGRLSGLDAMISSDRPVRFEGFVFDRLRRQLVSPDAVILPLSSAEYRLLLAFVEHPARVLSRDQIIGLTRAPGVEVNDRSIDLAVSRLRQKLGDSPREPKLIVTVRGEGYLFDSQITR